jgi:hypothetical protein
MQGSWSAERNVGCLLNARFAFGSGPHQPRLQPQPLAELRLEVAPVLDQRIRELAAVDQADAREARLQRHVCRRALMMRRIGPEIELLVFLRRGDTDQNGILLNYMYSTVR